MDKEKVQFDVVKSKLLKKKRSFFLLKISLKFLKNEKIIANDGFEAVNVVGKNGYLIIDIIAYKREIPPFDLEIINGLFVYLILVELNVYTIFIYT